MWQQADNDAYRLWRQRQEFQPAHIDRLLNSVTTTDRGPPPASARWIAAALAGASRRLFKRLYPTHPAAAIVPHPSK